MIKPAFWRHAFAASFVVFFSLPLCSEPSLPAGLGSSVDEPGEPQLPSGLGDEPALPSGISPKEDDWGDDTWPEDDSLWAEVEPANASGSALAGITGFAELRLGQRIGSAPRQRDATLSEARLELEKDWQWRSTSAKVTADGVYDAVEDSRYLDINSGEGWLDLREAWIQQRLGSAVDIKGGRQILTWGVGDLLFINDLFPKDWNSFLSGRDEQYLKAPSDALRLGWYSDAVNLNLVYTPQFDSDRYIDGRRLSYFSPLYGEVVGQNAVLDPVRPESGSGDDEWSLRVYRALGSYEVAAYGYDGHWKSPGGFDPVSGAAIFPRLRVLGASVRGPLGPGIVSAEVGDYRSRDDAVGDDPFVNNGEYRALAGFEWELMADTTLGLQYYLEILKDYGRYVDGLPAGAPARDEYRQLLTARLTRLAMGQNLTLSLFVFYSPTDHDAYMRPRIHFKVSDSLALEAGMNLFSGQDPHTFFGQFEDNSNFYGGVRYSF